MTFRIKGIFSLAIIAFSFLAFLSPCTSADENKMVKVILPDGSPGWININSIIFGSPNDTEEKNLIAVKLEDGRFGLVPRRYAYPFEKSENHKAPASFNTDMHRIKPNYVGCISKELLDRVTQFASQEDKVAFDKALKSGGCVILKTDLEVYLEEISDGKAKIRLPGQTTSIWTKVKAIK